MKKIKKMLLGTFGATAAIISITVVAVACSKTPSKTQNSVALLNGLISTQPSQSTVATAGSKYVIKNTDKNSTFYNTYVDTYKAFEMFGKGLDDAGYSISKHEPLKNSGKTTFLEYAKDLNNKVRNYVKAVANLPTIKSLRDKNIVVLFAETYEALNTKTVNASNLDLMFFQQANLFPILYAQPTESTPGFGLKFPKPNSDVVDKYFDNYHGIGANQTANPNGVANTWSATIIQNFLGTADYVFYNYNSNKLVNDDKSKTNPEDIKADFERTFRSIVPNQKIIPVDFQFDYASIWGPVGTVHFVESYAKKLGVTDSELASVANLKPTFPTKEQQVNIRPDSPVGDKNKFAVHFYSMFDYTTAFGIKPDYASYNSEQGTTYKKVAGFLQSIVNLDGVEFKLLTGAAQRATLEELKLHALATNQSQANRDFKQIFGEGAIVRFLVPTERGDSEKSSTTTTMKFYDRKTNTTHEVEPTDRDKKRYESF